MKPKRFKHRNLGVVVEAVKLVKGNQSAVAKWCKGKSTGRAKARPIFLSARDGGRKVKVDWWVVKIFDSFITVRDQTFRNIFVPEEDYIPVELLPDDSLEF